MLTFLICTAVLFLIIYLSFYIFLVFKCIKDCDDFDWFDFIWPLTWPVFLIAYWRSK